MPSVMEKPSAGSGILSRSRAKTAPNGGHPHSEDDSSEEEHSHGEPGGLGLKAHRSGGTEWGGRRVAGHGSVILMVSALLGWSLCRASPQTRGCRRGESGGWAPSRRGGGPALPRPAPCLRDSGVLPYTEWAPRPLPPCRGLRSGWDSGWKDLHTEP